MDFITVVTIVTLIAIFTVFAESLYQIIASLASDSISFSFFKSNDGTYNLRLKNDQTPSPTYEKGVLQKQGDHEDKSLKGESDPFHSTGPAFLLYSELFLPV